MELTMRTADPSDQQSGTAQADTSVRDLLQRRL